jgi:hypothetical protein
LPSINFGWSHNSLKKAILCLTPRITYLK